MQNAVPAFAEGNGVQRIQNETAHLEKMASHAAVKQTDQLQTIIDRSNTLITNRLTTLNTLLTRVQNDKRLTDTEKSSLSSDIQTTISGLTTLKAKIDADTDATTARADEKQIVTNYYVYAVLEPKIRLLVVINNLQTSTATLQGLVPQLQNLINTYKSQGKDVTQLQSLLDDISTQLQTINTTLTKDATTVDGVSLASHETAQATFTQVRQDLTQIVQVDFAKIRSDFEQMRSQFKQFTESTGTTTSSQSASQTLTTPAPSPEVSPPPAQ